MTTWTFEPGHTAAEFCVRHMMVTNVRGHFKNVHGTLEFNPDNPHDFSVEVTIDVGELSSGDPDRDGHLKSADFLDVDNYPEIIFKGNQAEIMGAHDYTVTGDLTIRGVTRQAILDVNFLGRWETPWWEGDEDKGPKTRAGFVAKTKINRHDFGISWNSELEKGGIVVGNTVEITIDAEAILESS
jgi:polyisoprenoid-binding protein YceI